MSRFSKKYNRVLFIINSLDTQFYLICNKTATYPVLYLLIVSVSFINPSCLADNCVGRLLRQHCFSITKP